MLTFTADNAGLLAGQTTVLTWSLQEMDRNGQVRPQALSLPQGSTLQITILSVVQSVLNLTGCTWGEVECVGVGSSALLSPSSSSPLLAVLGGVSSSPCDGWMGASSLSGNPVPPASPPDAIPGCSC